MRIEKNEEIEDKIEDTVVEAKTAKCPECGGKYLPETGYCPKCKKKVGKKKEEVETEVVEEDTATEEVEIIEIPEEVKLEQEDGSEIVLEKGDKIQIVKAEEVLKTSGIQEGMRLSGIRVDDFLMLISEDETTTRSGKEEVQFDFVTPYSTFMSRRTLTPIDAVEFKSEIIKAIEEVYKKYKSSELN